METQQSYISKKTNRSIITCQKQAKGDYYTASQAKIISNKSKSAISHDNLLEEFSLTHNLLQKIEKLTIENDTLKSENSSYKRINNELHNKLLSNKYRQINTDLQSQVEIGNKILDRLQCAILELKEVICSTKEIQSKEKADYELRLKRLADT